MTVILHPHPWCLRGGPLGVGTMIVTGIDGMGTALIDHIVAAAEVAAVVELGTVTPATLTVTV